MTITYEELFQFFGTFSNKELEDAQIIAEHCQEDFGLSYNNTLVKVLCEMRQQES